MSSPPLTQASTPTAPAKKGVFAIVGLLLLVELSSGFMQGFYTPLYGKMLEHWGVSDSALTMFVVTKTLAAAVCVPVMSKLGDIFGHRRMLRIAIILVTVGAAVVAFAPSFEVALIGRVLAGPLAVWLPLEIGIIHGRLTQATARKAIGLLVASITIGAMLGMIAAGALSTVLSMTALLSVPVALLLVCILAVYIAVPESVARASSKIDYVGFIGLAAFMCLLLGSLEVGSKSGFTVTTVALVIVAVVVLVAWVWWELRVDSPAIDIRLVTQPQLWPAYLVSFVLGALTLGTQTIIMTFLAASPENNGYGFGLTPAQLSLVTATMVLPATLASIFFSRAAKRIGLLGVLAIALSLAAVGQLMFIFLHSSLPLVITGSLLVGVGQGFMLGALPALIAEESPADATGIATGIYNSLKTLGGAVSATVFGIVLAAFAIDGQTFSSKSGYIAIWVICLGAVLIALCALTVIRRARPHTTAITVSQLEEEDA